MYNTFHYTLRRTLPPWSFQENLKELEQAVVKWQLDEVLVKVDTEEFSHGQVNLEWLDNYMPMLAELKAMLDRHGVLFSINPWITLCHLDRGRKGEDSIPGFRGMVDINGGVAQACACPLSEAWREHTRQVWQRYASLKPHSIWAEDDLRYLNHKPNVNYGCFCDKHLALFGKRLGLAKAPTREEVRTALFAEGEPHPWRRQWLEFLGDLWLESVEFLAKTVHEVDPEIRMGYMTSGARVHTIEGRDWTRLPKAATSGGKHGFLVRPNFGDYAEIQPRCLYFSFGQAALDRYVSPEAEALLTEVENFPYTRISRSVKSTEAELLMTALAGCHGTAMNLFDHFGNPMEGGRQFGAMMARMKPQLKAIGGAMRTPGRNVGVNLAFHQDYAKHCHLDENKAKNIPYGLMAPGQGAMDMLGDLGVPLVYDNDSQVTLLIGEMARSFDDRQIRQWLSRGLWLDSEAARILLERGYGEYLGITSIDVAKHPEEYHNASGEEFLPASVPPRFATLYVPCYGPNATISMLHLADGAVPFSRAVNCDREELGCIGSLYANSLGGRVFVHGFGYDPYCGDIGFQGTRRLDALRQMLSFLDAQHKTLLVTGDGVQPCAVQRQMEDGSAIVGFMNLSNDDWNEAVLQCQAFGKYSSALIQEGDGWVPFSEYAPSGDRLVIKRIVPALKTILLWLK